MLERALFAWIAALALTLAAHSQACPRENPNGPNIESGPVTISGTVVYHNEIRQWLELHPTSPVCGNDSIQLLDGTNGPGRSDPLRGCKIVAEGTLGIPMTGYYSSDLYLSVTKITPEGDCVRQAPFPDFSRSRPAKWVRNYRVEMRLDYSARGGLIAFTIFSEGHRLTPWQAYASYDLTGSYVLYGHCAEGYVVSRVFGTPQAHAAHFDEPGTPDDMAMFDPESAAAKHITKLTLGYICRR